MASDSAQKRAASALEPVTHRRVFEAILDQLEAAIDEGVLSAGDRLPSERDLAQQLRVSRTSVREALRALEALGLVETRRGSENGAVMVTEPGNAFATIVRLLAALKHIELAEIVEFRATVEAGAARTLAARGGAEELAHLDSILEEMERDDTSRARFHALDGEFHVSLVRSSGNRLVNLIESGVDNTLRELISDVGFLAARFDDIKPVLIDEHRALFDAIASGNEVAAADLATKHARYWGGRVITHAAGER